MKQNRGKYYEREKADRSKIMANTTKKKHPYKAG
jgi:hypothetical protein